MQPSFNASTAAAAVAASAASAQHNCAQSKSAAATAGWGSSRGDTQRRAEPTQVEPVAVHELCSGQQQLQRGVEEGERGKGGQCQGQDMSAPLVCQQAKQGDLLHFNNVSM